MRIVIDSIHDTYARVEFDTVMLEIPVQCLPKDAKEGDVLEFVKLDNSQILQDANARLDRMRALSTPSCDTFDL